MVILQSHLKSLVQDLLEYGKLTSLGTSNLFKQEVYTVELSRSLNPESTVEENTTNRASYYLHDFFNACQNFELPTNNPIAFFHVLEQKFPILYQNNRNELQFLMAYALAGHGFPFATYYTYEEDARMHPCIVPAERHKLNDPSVPVEEKPKRLSLIHEAYEYSVQRLADCAAGNSYANGYEWNSDNFFLPMKSGAKKFESWDLLLKKDAAVPFSHLSVSKSALKEFWKLYEQYTKMQYSVYEGMECEQAISRLDTIRKIAEMIFTLDRFWNLLERIKRTKDSANLKYKGKWLDLYRKYLLQLDTISKEIVSPFEGNSLLDTLRLRSFIKTARRDKLTQAELSSTSLWNKSVPYENLNRDDRLALLGYRKHCIYRFVQGIERILSKEGPLNAAPYFLYLFLCHNKDPAAPFKTVKYELNSSHTNFREEFCSLTDDRSIRMQKSHQWLYTALWRWWPSIHSKDFDVVLSHYLFLRTQRHIINHGRFLAVPLLGTTAEWLERATYRIQDELESVLEIESFMMPQYARVTVGYADFQKFYEKVSSEKASKQKEWKIRKILEGMITKSVAMEYKEKALIPIYGIGMAETTVFWHEDLADWLEKLIRSNNNVSNYVEGKFEADDEDDEPLFPETDFTISEYRDILTKANVLDPERSIYPEQFYPYLAQVELMIQKICCQRIKEDMLVRVMKMYRKAFLG